MAVSGLEDSPEGHKLWAYWVRGEGAAKIGWGEPDDYAHCLIELGKYTPAGAHGLCAEMHIAATGMTTTQHARLLGKDAGRHGSAADHIVGEIRGTQ